MARKSIIPQQPTIYCASKERMERMGERNDNNVCPFFLSHSVEVECQPVIDKRHSREQKIYTLVMILPTAHHNTILSLKKKNTLSIITQLPFVTEIDR